MSQRGYSDTGWPDWTPEVNYVTQVEARRMARRAFWLGAVIGGLLIGGTFIASADWGGDRADWGGTGCQIAAVTGEEHVAVITCQNVETSGQSFVAAEIEAGGIAVKLTVLHGPGSIPDRFDFLPAPGLFAVPQTLILDEWDGGQVLVYEFVGS